MINLIEIQNIIKNHFSSQFYKPNVFLGSIYENLNTSDIKYPAVNIDLNNIINNRNVDEYSFYIYYADRLTETGDNENQIYTDAITSIKLFIDYINKNYFPTSLSTIITPFRQKFADNCAGAWCQILIKVEDDIDYCYDTSETNSINITENGNYDVSNFQMANVDVTGIIPFISLEKEEDYLYKTTYEVLDYDFAKKYFREKENKFNGSCSVLRSGNYIGRNFDWFDNYDVAFVVKTPKTIGVTGSLSALSKQVVERRKNVEEYRVLPFYLVDGINSDGLFAEMNVVPSLGNKITIPEEEKRESICSIMLVRYILDNFTGVDEAIDYIKKYVEIYNPKGLENSEIHYMLSDNDTTKVLEIIDGRLVTIDSNISTNFHLYNVTLNSDGTVYTPKTAIEGLNPGSQGIENFANGLERWNILNNSNITDLDSMRNTMRNIYYSKTYTIPDLENTWFSEFVGGDITVDTPANDYDFIDRVNTYKEAFETHTKDDGNFWITTHQSLYDLNEKILYVSSQENDTEFSYDFSTLNI